MVTHVPVELSRFIAQAFVAGLWQGLVLVLAVMLLLRLAPGLSAAARYAIWWFAFALGAAIPLLHLPALGVLPVRAVPAVVHAGTEWGLAIAGLWAALMAVRATQLLTQAVHLHRIWKRATPVSADATIEGLLRSGGRVAELCISEDVDTPSVIGFFSPRLLIPTWLYATLAPGELEQIVLHECEHLRRRDDWINLLQKIGLVLFPLNPALLWMERRLSLERELACDAGVIASTKAPFDYARCLTRLAEHRLLHRRVALSLAAWSRQSELARRVHHLLKPAGGVSRWRVRLAAALICVGLVAGAAGMAGSPHLLSFTDSAAPVAQATAVVANSGSMRAVPVVYRPTAPAHAVLLKAITTPRKAHRAKHNSTHGSTPEAQLHEAQLHNVRATRSIEPEPRIVMTTVTIENDPFNKTGAVYLSDHLSSSYAAVRFDNGWIVIQL